jgi:hypothetical protein
VRWTDCCATKHVGGLGLIDPEEAILALVAKWIIRVITPGSAPLQILLRYRLLKIRPHAWGGWAMASHWAFTPRFKATRGSRAWIHIVQAWRKLLPFLSVRPPANACEVLTTDLWWSSYHIGGQFGFSHATAATLMKHGMQKIGDLWDPATVSFLSWYKAGMRFGLLPADRNCYNNLLDGIPQPWHDLLTDP